MTQYTRHIPSRDAIAPELLEKRRWIAWRYGHRVGSKPGEKPTKQPMSPHIPGRPIDTRDDRNYASFDEAIAFVSEQPTYAGVGYVLDHDEIGVDLDHALSPNPPFAYAMDTITLMGTYAELSPGDGINPGDGIKAIGRTPPGAPNVPKAAGVEVYAFPRFFTITGRRISRAMHVGQIPAIELQYLAEVSAKIRGKKPRANLQTTPTGDRPDAPTTSPDRRILDARLRAYADGLLRGVGEDVASAPTGTRNTTLYAKAARIGGYVAGGVITIDAAIDALARGAQSAGLGRGEIEGVIRRGLTQGMTTPQGLPASRYAGLIDIQTGEIIADAPTPNDPGDALGDAIGEEIAPAIARAIAAIDGEASGDAWMHSGTTLAELQSIAFDPLRWVVQDILPEGATLLAAKPKAKKSWLALAISIAVACGGKALGRLPVDPGRVLYLDLEGNQRRIQSRVKAILQHSPWPQNFHVFTDWTRGDDCVRRIETFVLAHPDTRLVVIDLLAEIRPPMDPRGDRYAYDRDLLVALNRLAEKYHIAILIIHHTRKAKGDDAFDEVSGTLGINGAAATLWILSRSPEGNVILNMQGRDLVRDDPLALAWDPLTCQFVIEGKASEVAISEERKRIRRILADGGDWTPRAIADAIGVGVNAISQLLALMTQDGIIRKSGYGKYTLNSAHTE